jgi:YidC/Oxa1 family membrane protein insertase
MDNQRIFLYGALGLLLLVIWQTWQVDYAQRPDPETLDESAEVADADDLPDAPVSDPDSPDEPAADEPDDETIPATGRGLPRGDRISVRTDLLDLTIDTQGGDIREARLLQHRETLDGDRRVELLSDEIDRLHVAQAGLQAGDRDAPTHHAQWSAEATEYSLGDADELRVPLTWNSAGLEVTKTFVLYRDEYTVDVEYEVENTADEAWDGRHYRQMQRVARADDQGSWFIRSYTGAAYYSPEDKYTRVSFDDIADSPLDRRVENGWIAMVDHYFLAAWIPSTGERYNFYTRVLNRDASPRYLIGLYSPTQRVASGETGRFESRLYLGPKEQSRLTDTAEGLNLSVDYGYMTLLSRPLFWVLDFIHDFIGNWGWSIVILTLLIKLVFYKLSEKSFKSMAHMRRAQPKMQQIKDRYGDDREKMGRAMMDLYKKEKINPLGGCLPILVQIPVFIALFWMLLGSIELRHAPFMFWIQDLSTRDPLFVLPLLMGLSMWLQQRLNPAPVDPLQQKIFMALPFVFTVFFAFFPAGLVLYWLTNNILSITQQYYITHYVVGDANKDRPAGTTAKQRKRDDGEDEPNGADDALEALESDADSAEGDESPTENAGSDSDPETDREADPETDHGPAGSASRSNQDVRNKKKKAGKRKGSRRK